MCTTEDLEKLNEGCLRGGKAGGKLRKMTVTGRMIPFPEKIIFVSTPLSPDDSKYKQLIGRSKRLQSESFMVKDTINGFVNQCLGIPWTSKMDFETMTEYNGFLVEV